MLIAINALVTGLLRWARWKYMVVSQLVVMVFAGSVCAQEAIGFDYWVVTRSAKTTEAFTQSGNDTSLGVYCAGDQCLFYLKMPLVCTPGSQSVALINNGHATKAFVMECLPVGQSFFQVLKPFDEVLATLLAGEQAGVAVPIQSSGFAVSRFESRGARQAIDRAIYEATIRLRQNSTFIPEAPQSAPQGKLIQL